MIKKLKPCFISVIILTLFFSIKSANGSNGNLFQDQFSFLNFFAGIPQLAQVLPTAENEKIKMRDFSIDTQGKSLFNSNVDIENDGRLIEYVNGNKIKDWKIKYEKKGSSRGMCEPPVINLSFDKFDSKGNAKELFTGLSTYKDNKTLQYQKIRLIPECDIWTDYFSGGRIGFRGQLNVNLREFIVHKIFREFKIPTADVLGFANVNIVSNDVGYNGKTFRYMIIQRPQELDDQIPFTTQFNLKSEMYTSSSRPEWVEKYDDIPAIFTKKIVNNKTREERVINFDIESKMRFDILTSFLNLGDMGFLHNEDGGIDINTGLVKSIPHGFDASFECYIEGGGLSLTNLYQMNSPEQKYKDIFYSVSREIFLDSKNLDKMISFVDSFPYTNVDKELLKKFLKIRFYQYSTYANSSEFAKSSNKDYLPKVISLPFKNEQEYLNALTDFKNRCDLPKINLNGVSVSDIKDFSISSTTDNNPYYNISFVIDVKTGDKALQLFRKHNVFAFSILDAKDGKKIRDVYMPIISIKGINQNVIGPYYEIPPNTTVSLTMGYTLNRNNLIKGEYIFAIDSFTPNNNFNPFKLNYKTKIFSLGKVEPIVVTSPRLGEVIDSRASSTYMITWSGEKDRYMSIHLNDERGNIYYIINPAESKKFSNKFIWDTGKVYRSQSNNYVLSSLPDGKYSIVVTYSDLIYSQKEISFSFVTSENKKPTISISNVKAKLNYNVDSSESYVTVNSEIDISVPTSTKMIVPQKHAFGVYGRNEKGNYLDGNTVYTSNEAKLNGENYELTGGKNYRFSLVTRTQDVINAFPGVYTFGVGGMSYGNNYENNLQFPIKAPNISNKLAIVGEKSPYINSIDSPIYYDKPVVIRGVRFGKDMVRILVGKDEWSDSMPTNSYMDDTVIFIPKYLGLEKGFIPIQIVNKYGASNYYYFELK